MDIILAVLFVAIPAIVLLITILLGIKRNIFQSLAKLIMTILAIVVSAVLVKTLTPVFASDLVSALNLSGAEIINYFQSFSMAEDVFKLLSALVTPLVFVVVFIVINFIFDLLYLIPGRLLSNKAFAKRAAKASKNGAQETEPAPQEAEQIDEQNIAQKKKLNWTKVGLRSGAIVCNIMAAVLVLSMFALPINAYYSIASNTILGQDVAIDLGGDIEEIIAVAEDVNSHPTNLCYSAFNGLAVTYFDRFTAQDGSKISVSDTLSGAVSIIGYASDLDMEELNPGVLSEFADKLSQNIFIKNIATRVISDMCNAWMNGETFLGMAAPELEGDLMNVLLAKLADCNDISVAIRAAANALTLSQAMTPDNMNGAGDTASMIGQVFTDLDSDTADMIKTFVSDEVLTDIVAIPPSMAQSVSGFVDGVLDGVVAIKDDPNLSDEEKQNLLNQEATAMASILDMAKEPETIAPDKLVQSIVDSTVIAGTIQGITDNGSSSDPYGIADALSPEFTESVSEQLEIQGVEENSDLYKSIMALIQK